MLIAGESASNSRLRAGFIRAEGALRKLGLPYISAQGGLPALQADHPVTTLAAEGLVREAQAHLDEARALMKNADFLKAYRATQRAVALLNRAGSEINSHHRDVRLRACLYNADLALSLPKLRRQQRLLEADLAMDQCWVAVPDFRQSEIYHFEKEIRATQLNALFAKRLQAHKVRDKGRGIRVHVVGETACDVLVQSVLMTTSDNRGEAEAVELIAPGEYFVSLANCNGGPERYRKHRVRVGHAPVDVTIDPRWDAAITDASRTAMLVYNSPPGSEMLREHAQRYARAVKATDVVVLQIPDGGDWTAVHVNAGGEKQRHKGALASVLAATFDRSSKSTTTASLPVPSTATPPSAAVLQALELLRLKRPRAAMAMVARKPHWTPEERGLLIEAAIATGSFDSLHAAEVISKEFLQAQRKLPWSTRQASP
ncbi:MAG: hypothetical protein MO852_12690 [Candidatus Devosia euplotis]|nr:hypothetical protein [Candidatus Devosia euplotis]